jgi:hypothetical protein
MFLTRDRVDQQAGGLQDGQLEACIGDGLVQGRAFLVPPALVRLVVFLVRVHDDGRFAAPVHGTGVFLASVPGEGRFAADAELDPVQRCG